MSSTAVALTSTPSSALQPLNRPSTDSAQAGQSTFSRPSPSTPKQQLVQLPAQPGTWRHPQMDAIARRQNRSVFGSDNAWSAVKNAILLLVALTSPPLAASLSPSWLHKSLNPLNPYYSIAILVMRLFFLANLIFAFRPLLRSSDEIEDIPLTPSQRALLGLKPSNTPLTPGSQVLTPPRYSRSVTPKSAASDRAASGSPFSASDSPLGAKGGSSSMDRSVGPRGASGSPFSGSPLMREALTGSAGRRLSFDVSNSGGGSSSSGLPSTPTPAPIIGAGRATVGLNNKWLYQHSRGSPNGRSPFS